MAEESKKSSIFRKKIGNTEYIVHAKSSEDATEDFETKLCKVIERDVLKSMAEGKLEG